MQLQSPSLDKRFHLHSRLASIAEREALEAPSNDNAQEIPSDSTRIPLTTSPSQVKSVPNITLHLSHPYTMEPSWSSHGFYASTYYPHDPPRSTHRPGHSLPQPATPATPGPLGPPPPDIAHRRAQTQPGPGPVPGSYLPPPPPPPIHSSSHQGHELPSFSHSFYSPYSTSTPQHQQSTSAPSGLHYHSSVPPPLPPYSGGGAGGGSSNGVAGGSSSNGFSDFPTASPGISSHLMSSSRGQFPGLTTGGFHESPRLPGSAATTSGTFSSSSPGLRNFSPTSPTTHLAPPIHSLTAVSSGGSTSSSSYLSSNPGHLTRRGEPLPSLSAGMDALAMRKKRGVSPPFNPISSWEEDIDSKYGILQSEEAGDGKHDQDRYDAHCPGSGSSKFDELPLEEYEDQPWGMPQEEYKALNSRDKKQVRNRIGARRFRAKRKNYVSSLETAVRSRDEEIRLLREQALGYRSEIDELRAQLGIHPLPELPTPPLRRQILVTELASPEAGSGALGLVVSHPGIRTVWDDEH